MKIIGLQSGTTNSDSVKLPLAGDPVCPDFQTCLKRINGEVVSFIYGCWLLLLLFVVVYTVGITHASRTESDTQ